MEEIHKAHALSRLIHTRQVDCRCQASADKDVDVGYVSTTCELFSLRPSQLLHICRPSSVEPSAQLMQRQRGCQVIWVTLGDRQLRMLTRGLQAKSCRCETHLEQHGALNQMYPFLAVLVDLHPVHGAGLGSIFRKRPQSLGRNWSGVCELTCLQAGVWCYWHTALAALGHIVVEPATAVTFPEGYKMLCSRGPVRLGRMQSLKKGPGTAGKPNTGTQTW